jgi:hypothetical protein
MPKIDAWQGNAFPLADWLSDIDQSTDTARLIADKPVDITPIRGGVAQPTEAVRVEFLSRPREVETGGGNTAMVDTLVLGYKGHPTLNDTDLQRGDRFALAGQQYDVVVIAPGLDSQLQAYCKVRN